MCFQLFVITLTAFAVTTSVTSIVITKHLKVSMDEQYRQWLESLGRVHDEQ